MLAPGATIGILGGGQLGRMTALAAAALGYRCHVFADEADCAGGAGLRRGDGRDVRRRAPRSTRFAAAVDVATFEFENIPAAAVRRVAAATPVLPRPEILEIAQDRLREKDFLRSIGVDDDRFTARSTMPPALAAARSPRLRRPGRAQDRAHGL